MLRVLCFTFAALFSVALAGEITTQPCKSPQPISAGEDVRLYSADFPDGTTEPVLKKGNTYTLDIVWYGGPVPSANLTAVVQGEINGIPLPFSGVNANACLSLIEGSCPISPGNYYYYRYALKVESSYPAVNLFIIWTLKRADGMNEVCIRVPARIVT